MHQHLFLIRIIFWQSFKVSTALYDQNYAFLLCFADCFENGLYFDNEVMLKVDLGIRGITFAAS